MHQIGAGEGWPQAGPGSSSLLGSQARWAPSLFRVPGREVSDKMRCSGSRDLCDLHSAVLSDPSPGLFTAAGGGAGERLRLCSASLSPSTLPSLSLLSPLFSSLPSLCPYPTSLPFPPALSCSPSPGWRRSGRLPGGRAAHPLRHFPLSDLNVKSF